MYQLSQLRDSPPSNFGDASPNKVQSASSIDKSCFAPINLVDNSNS